MSASNSTGSGAGAGGKAPFDYGHENAVLSNYLYIICGSVAGALIVYRVCTMLVSYIRAVVCLSNDTQRYFAEADTRVSWFRREMLYAPVLSKRHNREIQLSSAVNIGTLPSRLQLFFLLGYFATNVAFCLVNIPLHSNFETAANQLRNRSGVLAVVNMVPLFLMATRNNPLISWLNMSFDTFNLLHRWFGRIVVLEALTHTIAYLVPNLRELSWGAEFAIIGKVPFLLYGLIATIALILLSIQAMSPLRHAFYETFKIMHIGLAIVTIIGVYYHLHLIKLPQLKYIYAVMAIWLAERSTRVLRVLYHNVGAGGTHTLVEALPGNACRVTVTMARPWKFEAGQHAYLYLPRVSLWQSHPFSAAWSEDAESHDVEDKLEAPQQDVLSAHKTSISFVIRGRTGMTGKLYKMAAAAPDGRWSTMCMVEGPYGGLHSLRSYGTVMLFAGGVGITQAVPHVRELVVGYANGTVAARKVVLVWIIQSPEHLEWIRPWMTQILALDRRREVLRIMLFVSRPRSTKEIHSPSATVQMFPGRPNINTLLGIEMEQQVGTIGVTVCGPGALSDEVRRAVRQRQYQGSIEFKEEAFSW